MRRLVLGAALAAPIGVTPLAGQIPDGSAIIDSLRSVHPCPKVLPPIRHETWEVAAEDACVLVTTALREFARQVGELPDFSTADTSRVSGAAVEIGVLTSDLGVPREAVWRITLDIAGNRRVFFMTIDLRTGHSRVGSTNGSQPRRE